MLKFCRDAWDANKDKLENAIRHDTKINCCEYSYLVELIIKHILNPSVPYPDDEFDYENITTIDNGDYQGTLLFVFPRKTYQPEASEYLMAYAGYGSCGGCDTLLSIKEEWHSDKTPNEIQVKDYMSLCKDIVCSIVKPYNYGWRRDVSFKEVEDDNNAYL
jgi:hypothetical protein